MTAPTAIPAIRASFGYIFGPVQVGRSGSAFSGTTIDFDILDKI